ncbi:hypothetical protein N7462_005398 [Penicillium macrosclerotiorum]|uniref:uncharacterized protein n=1 Tax=Penicillium macrosclerotiorum TaxID=303699 RepID=UPI002549AF4B|nr:uncharacterized protein N7462_005398 [Penicillium macrosclerotiorum]KAJ5682233.1 hypothetical protein N7462_005398 [Penicillium macrosclerotiorum]
MPPPKLSQPITSIQGVRVAGSSSIWDINLQCPSNSSRGTIASVTPHANSLDCSDQLECPLALPALTHPHIHLDKAFVHNAREYVDLLPCEGTFQEALSFTTKAKQQFTLPDILKRGEWLLAESVSSGVTAMRAFVEVDHTVNLTCVDAAVTLKRQWQEVCEIQVVSFAQDPLFSTLHGEENRSLIEEALGRFSEIDVIGTTPYVESTAEAAKSNIDWAIDRAMQLDKHLDFHLDYNLDPNREALLWHVLEALQQRGWTASSTRRRVMLGHCTRLTLLTDEEWSRAAQIIRDQDLPVSFVGLPTSDLYMASPPDPVISHHRPRGTLRVPEIIRRHGLDAVLGVNNVGNAFTPWGSADPLFLACVGVGVYQAGTQSDAALLYECVSTRARAAIGLAPSDPSLVLQTQGSADLLLFNNHDDTGCGVFRPRASVAEVVWDPPVRSNRHLIVNGRRKIPQQGLASNTAVYRFRH